MQKKLRWRVVLDTNTVFEGLTKQGGSAGVIIEAWRARLLTVCISNALWYEYEDVFSRLLTRYRWNRIQPVLNALVARAEFTTVYFSWRPASRYPGDDHEIDCTLNANAFLITSNLRDFRVAQQHLGLRVIPPDDFAPRLAE